MESSWINKMKNIIILLISISIIYGQGTTSETSMAEDLIVSGGIMFVLFTITGETINCLQPYYDGEYQSKCFVCQWTADTFYYENGEYILYDALLNDPDASFIKDNWIEKKMRKRYWKKRDKNFMISVLEKEE